MSIQTHTENRRASPTETTIEADREVDSTAADGSASTPSFDDHASAATFDTASTLRLPNTVDDENKYVG